MRKNKHDIKTKFVCKECHANKCKITVTDFNTHSDDPELPKVGDFIQCVFAGPGLDKITPKWVQK